MVQRRIMGVTRDDFESWINTENNRWSMTLGMINLNSFMLNQRWILVVDPWSRLVDNPGPMVGDGYAYNDGLQCLPIVNFLLKVIPTIPLFPKRWWYSLWVWYWDPLFWYDVVSFTWLVFPQFPDANRCSPNERKPTPVKQRVYPGTASIWKHMADYGGQPPLLIQSGLSV